MNIPLFFPTPQQDTIAQLIEYCEARSLRAFMLIADRNTYPILGQAVEQALLARGWDVKKVVFEQDEVVPDETFLVQALVQADQVERMYLAVGSGTLTDITRFVSHRTRRPFLSLPPPPRWMVSPRPAPRSSWGASKRRSSLNLRRRFLLTCQCWPTPRRR